MWTGEGAPAEIVEKHGLKQVTDTGALEKAIDELIAANPGQAAAVKEKPQAIGWFVGQVMKATGGKANPAAVNDILKAKLGALAPIPPRSLSLATRRSPRRSTRRSLLTDYKKGPGDRSSGPLLSTPPYQFQASRTTSMM